MGWRATRRRPRGGSASPAAPTGRAAVGCRPRPAARWARPTTGVRAAERPARRWAGGGPPVGSVQAGVSRWWAAAPPASASGSGVPTAAAATWTVLRATGRAAGGCPSSACVAGPGVSCWADISPLGRGGVCATTGVAGALCASTDDGGDGHACPLCRVDDAARTAYCVRPVRRGGGCADEKDRRADGVGCSWHPHGEPRCFNRVAPAGASCAAAGDRCWRRLPWKVGVCVERTTAWGWGGGGGGGGDAGQQATRPTG